MAKIPANPVIGIVGGRGVMGQMFAREFLQLGYEVLISDRKPAGKKILSNKKLIEKTDVVIVSVTLGATEKALQEIVPLVREDQLLLDFTSVKELPVKKMLESKSAVIGLHPMFGPVEQFAGHNIFVCKSRPGVWWPWLKKVLTEMGLSIHLTTPRAHDAKMATLQSLHHLTLLTLAEVLARRGVDPRQAFAESSPSMQLALVSAGRLLAADSDLYRDIAFLNPADLDLADQLEEVMGEVAEIVRSRDAAGWKKVFDSAAKNYGDFRKWTFDEAGRMFAGAEKKSEKPAKKNSPKSKKISRPNCAVLGPATQTEIAAEEFFRKAKAPLSPKFWPTIAGVFESVRTGQTRLGFIPLENYSVGPVRETVTQLFNSKGEIEIIGELSRPIAHALLGQSKLTPKKVERIFAHPQARAQCRNFLQRKYPHSEIVETAHTGESVERATEDSSALAIGPVEAARPAGLSIVAKNIEDDPNNRTRFVAIRGKSARKIFPAKKRQKTALAFFFSADKAGQLAPALQVFADHGVNLSRIESIPDARARGRFFFFTEADVDQTAPKFSRAIDELEKMANVVIFGSYGSF